MNCKKFRYAIPDLIRGRLSDTEQTMVRGHLATCTLCQNEMEEFRSLFSEIEKEVSWKPSDNYLATILPRVHELLDRKHLLSLPSWISRFAVPLASAAIIVIFLTKVVPVNFNNPSLITKSSLESLSADDLSDYIEQQFVVGVGEFSGSENRAKELSEDKSILKNIFVDEHPGYAYLASDQESIYDVVSDRDIEELIPMLEKNSSPSTNE